MSDEALEAGEMADMAQDRIEELKAERDALRAKVKELEQTIRGEMMDPNGTIWEAHAMEKKRADAAEKRAKLAEAERNEEIRRTDILESSLRESQNELDALHKWCDKVEQKALDASKSLRETEGRLARGVQFCTNTLAYIVDAMQGEGHLLAWRGEYEFFGWIADTQAQLKEMFVEKPPSLAEAEREVLNAAKAWYADRHDDYDMEFLNLLGDSVKKLRAVEQREAGR